MNLNQINNQQSDPTAALVEKLINSIDAVLLGELTRLVLIQRAQAHRERWRRLSIGCSK